MCDYRFLQSLPDDDPAQTVRHNVEALNARIVRVDFQASPAVVAEILDASLKTRVRPGLRVVARLLQAFTEQPPAVPRAAWSMDAQYQFVPLFHTLILIQ